MRNLPPNITKELLNKLYIEERRSCLQVGMILNKSPRQVSRYLQRFDIQARPLSSFTFRKGSQPRLGAVLSQETRAKISKAHMGKVLSEEHRAKVVRSLSLHRAGESNPNWQGGITPETIRRLNKLRQNTSMRLWRKAVYDRDNRTCVLCGAKNKVMHADHIKSFSLYPELRTSIENGRVLCIQCHRKTDTYGGKSKVKIKN